MAVNMKWLHDNLVPLYWSSQYAREVNVIAPLNRYCTLIDDWCVCVCVCVRTYVCVCVTCVYVRMYMHACVPACVCVLGMPTCMYNNK